MAIWANALDLDCNKCSNSQKALYGCEVDSQVKDMWQISGYILQRCPLSQIDFRVNDLFIYYKKYEKGYLPNSGGWLEQSAIFNDVIGIIETEYGKVAIEKAKKGGKK